MKKFLCFAHRGASGHEPENTLSSVEKAISLGADWVEVDVYAIEGELIVFHDERLERTTNGTGYVMDKSLSYLRSLDAGRGQRIPLLREVFDLANKKIGINVELKGKGTAGLTVDTIDKYVKNRGWGYEQFIVSSFDHGELLKVREKQPLILAALVLGTFRRRYKAFAKRYGLYSVHMRFDLVNKRFVTNAKKAGLKVFAYTVNDPMDIKQMREMEVDGIFTDFPERVKSL